MIGQTISHCMIFEKLPTTFLTNQTPSRQAAEDGIGTVYKNPDTTPDCNVALTFPEAD